MRARGKNIEDRFLIDTAKLTVEEIVEGKIA